MTITATQVLTLLNKATQLGIHYGVYDGEEYGHFIQFEVDWYVDERGRYSYKKVFVTNEDESTWENGWEFTEFMNLLDEKLKEQAEKEIKENKRKELIDSLTPEQRELLGL